VWQGLGMWVGTTGEVGDGAADWGMEDGEE